MTINPVIPYSDIDSGINFGFILSVNPDNVTLEISSGEYRFSNYNGSRPLVFPKNAVSILPGQQTTTYPDLNSVVPSWPPLTGSETVHFYVIGRDGVIYQTGTSILTGEIVRNFLSVGATSLDNTVDRNITAIFDFKNINSSDYEMGNVLTPLFVNADSLNLTGKSDLTFARSAGGILFSGSNISNSVSSPSLVEYPAQDPTIFLSAHRYSNGTFYLSPVQTDFSPFIGLYDDGTAPPGSVLPVGSVQNNRWVVHYIFFEVSLGLHIIQIGQRVYNSIGSIERAFFLEQESIEVAPFLSGVKNAAYLIVKGDADSLDPSDDEAYIISLDRKFFKRG